MADPEPRCPKCGGPWHLYCGNDEVYEDLAAEEAALRRSRIARQQVRSTKERGR